MPHVQLIVNGNGQATLHPSSEVSAGTVCTVRAYPYEGEIVDSAEFEEYRNGTWQWIGVSEIEHNVWKFRVDNNDIRAWILFTSRYDPPPEPPEPPTPTPTVSDIISVLFAKSRNWWRY